MLPLGSITNNSFELSGMSYPFPPIILCNASKIICKLAALLIFILHMREVKHRMNPSVGLPSGGAKMRIAEEFGFIKNLMNYRSIKYRDWLGKYPAVKKAHSLGSLGALAGVWGSR